MNSRCKRGQLEVFAPLVRALVFKTSGGFEQSSQWVRFPYTSVFFMISPKVHGEMSCGWNWKTLQQGQWGGFLLRLGDRASKYPDHSLQRLCSPGTSADLVTVTAVAEKIAIGIERADRGEPVRDARSRIHRKTQAANSASALDTHGVAVA